MFLRLNQISENFRAYGNLTSVIEYNTYIILCVHTGGFTVVQMGATDAMAVSITMQHTIAIYSMIILYKCDGHHSENRNTYGNARARLIMLIRARCIYESGRKVYFFNNKLISAGNEINRGR